MDGCPLPPSLGDKVEMVKGLNFLELCCEPEIKEWGRGGVGARGWLSNEIMVIILLVALLLCRHGRRLSE